jgi:hypothetical protein
MCDRRGEKGKDVKNEDLGKTATVAVHKAAIDYCDGLTAAGEENREAMLTSMGLLIGEAALIAHAARLTVDGFCQVAGTLYGQAEELARRTKP